MSEEFSVSERTEHATSLLEDFELHQDAEFFQDPENRLEFLNSLTFEEFRDITTHVNDRVRGYEPRHKTTQYESGGSLYMFKTPKLEEKQTAYRMGFDVIQNYINESDDTTEDKIKGVGKAVEALIIWVHPFNDGNGRTSRFMSKFIEDGTTDLDSLLDTTARNTRLRDYGTFLRVDDMIDADNMDLMLDDEEREEVRRRQKELPITEGIALSINRLLYDKALQDRVDADAQRRLEVASRFAISA